jgi:hypothetical protein
MAEVYANGNAIACKKGDDKVIAAFPDVCLSPPSPPAGPVPVPYPNTSFSKDMRQGSKTVKINGGEVMLKDQSFYKTSPLGNEAATRSFGGSVITHVITGKTYFNMWSMDVKFEGQNVDRHKDLTTSNHASYPGGPPTNAIEKEMKRLVEEERQCPCCLKEIHSNGQAMSADQWYEKNCDRKQKGWQNQVDKGNQDAINNPQDYQKYKQELLDDARAREGCFCPYPTKVMPEPPCNIFYSPTSQKEAKKIQNRHDNTVDRYRKDKGLPDGSQINHLVPKTAGGCPDGEGNLQPHDDLCSVCQKIDGRFNKIQ